MKKIEKIIIAISLLVGLIAAGIIFNSYNHAPDKIDPTIITLETIPVNAEKVSNIEDVNDSYQNATYGNGKQAGFTSSPIYDLSFFKNKEMDKIYVSFSRDTRNMYDKGVISVRGINESELPRVYDYQEIVAIEEARPMFKVWIFQAIYYDSLPSFGRTNLGWILNIEHSKIGPVDAVMIAITFGMIYAFVALFLFLIVVGVTEAITRMIRMIKSKSIKS